MRTLAIALCACVCATAGASDRGLEGRVIAGYQGWFGCPGDFKDNKEWRHWFIGGVAPDHLSVDLLPTHQDLPPAALCDTGIPMRDGTTLKLYSSQNEQLLASHFQMMRAHGIDGVALQRFVTNTGDPEKRARFDHLAVLLRKAAEDTGRVFFITYDVSGADERGVTDSIRADWIHLTRELKLTESPSYLTDAGKPVLELWGFGFKNRPGRAPDVAALIGDLKNGRAGLPKAYVLGGVPTSWRTLKNDSKANPEWAPIYRSYDAISPWLVGRFADDAGADARLRDFIEPDLAETRRLGILYMPVTFPGFSTHNQTGIKRHDRAPPLNEVPRRCGAFLWHQYVNLLHAGVTSIYAAMFDEFDEGTAIAPAMTTEKRFPVGATLVALDDDGCDAPSDWYLTITGKAAELLRSHGPVPEKVDKISAQ